MKRLIDKICVGADPPPTSSDVQKPRSEFPKQRRPTIMKTMAWVVQRSAIADTKVSSMHKHMALALEQQPYVRRSMLVYG